MTRKFPWESGDDKRLETDLNAHAMIEAAKVWGGFMEDMNTTDTDTMKTWAWECCLAAMRVYEFERSSPLTDRQNPG